MFNRQPFNRGKFNTTSLESSSLMGEAEINLNLSGKLSVVRAATGKAEIFTMASGTVIRTQNINGGANVIVSGNDLPVVRKRPFAGNSNINVDSDSEGFNTYGYEFMKLPGLVLLPGDELIINTGEMTVELNGQNVIRYFSRDSEFFNIKPGENIILYESGAVNSNVDIKILWKDAYL